jgi:hypothetical protein
MGTLCNLWSSEPVVVVMRGSTPQQWLSAAYRVFDRLSESSKKESSLETFAGIDVDVTAQAGWVLVQTSIHLLTKGTRGIGWGEISRNSIGSSGGMMPSAPEVNLTYYSRPYVAHPSFYKIRLRWETLFNDQIPNRINAIYHQRSHGQSILYRRF